MGITTNTYDTVGEILSQKSVSNLPLEVIEQVLKDFKGSIEQIPPDFSAVHYKGKRLYELARKGIEVPKKTRTVYIKKLEIFKYYPQGPHPRIIIDITCSKGTYIRTLCSDIGEKLGTGAVLSFLIRTSSGPFKLEDSLTIEEIKENISKGNYDFILPMNYLVKHLPVIEVDLSDVKRIKNGSTISMKQLNDKILKNNSMAQIIHNDKLIAVGQVIISNGKKLIKPKKVFI
ncbi:MAG: tRNA pseudouridine synthase B [Clostridia bacterium 41_269]|nr:MAG: tRNA pseudouridine synthase B [Clostridia bacterium 41_269]